MADDELKPAIETGSNTLNLLPLDTVGSVTAPFVYFDIAATGGAHFGVGNVTLEAFRHLVAADGTNFRDRVVVAHLRCSVPAAMQLRDVLDGLIFQATPAVSNAAN